MDELTKTTRRIVVGIDGSDGSARALKQAIQLARDAGAEVLAVHVLTEVSSAQYSLGLSPVPLPSEDWRKEQARAFSEEWCNPLDTCGVAYRKVFAEGQPAVFLIDFAKKEGGELIVVGSRGHGTFTEVLLGSVSHYLAHHSPVPVLIVPPLPRVKAPSVAEQAEKEPELAATGSGIYF